MVEASALPDYDDNFYLEEGDNDNEFAVQGNGQQAAGGAKPAPFVGVHATSFKDMLLKPELQRAIVDCGFEHPSDVQQKCIPEAILGVDVLCQAVSGMGKTAVFVLTVLQNLSEDPKPGSALILCHTRELAYQIKNEFVRFTKYMKNCRTEVIYGGEPIKTHIELLKGLKPPHIVVGTPGRILQLVKEKHLTLNDLKMFVLDECDKVLEQMSK